MTEKTGLNMKERIPFDIKFRPEIEAGKYLVVTREGRKVGIDRWDWPHGDYPIVAHIEGVGGRFTYTDKGVYDKGKYDTELNLFLIPNPDYADPSVDWDAFRREAAKDILCAIIPLDWEVMASTREKMCRLAIDAADELIKQLKENKK